MVSQTNLALFNKLGRKLKAREKLKAKQSWTFTCTSLNFSLGSETALKNHHSLQKRLPPSQFCQKTMLEQIFQLLMNLGNFIINPCARTGDTLASYISSKELLACLDKMPPSNIFSLQVVFKRQLPQPPKSTFSFKTIQVDSHLSRMIYSVLPIEQETSVVPFNPIILCSNLATITANSSYQILQVDYMLYQGLYFCLF